MPENALHQHQFPNGLTLLAEVMPGVQSASFAFLVPAGSIYEPADRAGTATLTAEWITRGAGELDSRDLIGALDDLGVTHGESASTLHTTLTAATLGRNLLPALSIFADILQRPLLDDEEIEPIRALALQSLQSLEDDPGSKAILELRRRHFPDPWGRPSVGSAEGIRGATPESLRDFHGRLYRPNGALIGVAGAIDWPQLLDETGRLFGDWEPREEPAILAGPGGPSRDHILKDTQQIQIALAYPSVTVDHPDYYRARAVSAILGGYASARLFTEVREKRGLCYSVYSSYEGFNHLGAVLCYAGTSADRAQETLDVTLGEIHRLADSGVELEELDMMRAGLKSSLIMSQESSMARASSMASDWYFLNRVRSLEEIRAALDTLTPEDVSAFAKGQQIDRATILTLGPRALSLPS
ncbi:MAG: pitrilysin family protein [Isosphaeraceae bacterium]